MRITFIGGRWMVKSNLILLFVICFVFAGTGKIKAQEANDSSQMIELETAMVDSLINSYSSNYTGWYIPYKLRLSPEISFFTGSNVLPQVMLNRIAFGGHIESDLVNKTERRLQPNNRMGFEQSISLFGHFYPVGKGYEYFGYGGINSSIQREDINGRLERFASAGLVVPEKEKSEINNSKNKSNFGLIWLGLEYRFMASARFTDDAYRAIMQGNGYYRGQELNVGKNRYKQLGYYGADFMFYRNKKKNSKDSSNSFVAPVAWFVSLRNLNSFQSLRTSDISVFTSAVADSVSLDGRFYQVNAIRGQVNPGIAIGFSKWIRFNESPRMSIAKFVLFSAQDVGFYYLPKAQITSRGYIWDASGQGLRPELEAATQSVYIKQASVTASNLQLGNWFTQQVDTAEARLRVLDQQRNGWIISPFYIKVNTLSGISLSYRYLPGMKPVFSVYPGMKIKSVQRFCRELFHLSKGSQYSNEGMGSARVMTGDSKMYFGFAAGGFDRVNWKIGYESDYLNGGKILKLKADIIGVEALLLPNTFHGLGAVASLVALF